MNDMQENGLPTHRITKGMEDTLPPEKSEPGSEMIDHGWEDRYVREFCTIAPLS